MVLPVFPTLAIGVITLVVWCIYNVWQQKQRYPPGPLNLPVVATVSTMLEMMSEKRIWISLTELQKKYGDVFTVFYINQPTVILGSIEAVQEALVTKKNDFEGRPHSHFNEYFSNGYRDIVFSQPTPVWKRQRKIAQSTFRKFASGECLEKNVLQSFAKVATELDKMANTGKKFNPKHSLDMAIYNTIMAMTFGKTFEHSDPFMMNFIRLMDDMNDAFSEGLMADFIPIFEHIPTKGLKTFHEAMDELHNLVKDIYEDHVKTFDESNPKDIVDQMLQAVQKTKTEEGQQAMVGVTVEHHQMAISDIFSAGTDTSRYSLIWAILYLTAFPECQKKLRAEVDSVIGSDSHVSERHRSDLVYTKAFLYEVMRIKPILPLSLTHATTCDTSVGGYSIPAGTQVIPNCWAIHMNKDVWGDPEAFRPERYLEEDGKMGPPIPSWIPFSIGNRACIGEALAKAELTLLLAAFVQRYEFRAPTGTLMNLEPKPGQLMIPDDFDLLVYKRN